MDSDTLTLLVAVAAAAISLTALVLGAFNRVQDRRDQQREREIRGDAALDLAFDALLEWDRTRSQSSLVLIATYLERAAQLLPPDEIRLVRYRAYRARDVGDAAEAVALLEPLVTHAEVNGQFWIDLARARSQAEGTEASILAALEKAKLDRPYAATAIVDQAQRLRFRRRAAEALDLLAEAERLESRNPHVLQLTAEFLLELATSGTDPERSLARARDALVTAIEYAPVELVADLVGDLAATYRPFERGALPPPTASDLWMNERLLDLAADAGSFQARAWRTATTADAARVTIRDRSTAERHVARALEGWRSGEHPRTMFGAIHDTLTTAAPHLAPDDSENPTTSRDSG